MHTVRKQILEILKEHGEGATVAELAETLEMAPVSVRHHLDILQGDNLIGVNRVDRKGAVGRPQQVYALTSEARNHFPNNFAALATHLVTQIKEHLPPEQVTSAFRSMAREIAAEFPPPTAVVDEQALETRLGQVAQFLSQRGYLARWERVADNGHAVYLLHKHNCPYCGVSAGHPELCFMDQVLIDELVGQPCQRIQSMAANDHCCTYCIKDGCTSDKH